MTHDQARSAPCDVVRVTPSDTDGNPQHDEASVHHFSKPVSLLYATRRSETLSGDRRCTADRPRLPGLVALTALPDHAEPAAVDALARVLEERRGRITSVDAWSQSTDGFWVYTLVLRWQDLPPEDWPHDLAPDARTLAVAVSRPAHEPYPWPDPAPFLGHPDTSIGTEVFLSTDCEPPPPATQVRGPALAAGAVGDGAQ
ncbi:hypothetical protein [Streptomyces sp. NPDC053560]|uniref:hypothetical protein n=1 Tax=Streptomyces sp. NPDC053560 TaxID=3365711 RepID=UPI0037D6A3C6